MTDENYILRENNAKKTKEVFDQRGKRFDDMVPSLQTGKATPKQLYETMLRNPLQMVPLVS